MPPYVETSTAAIALDQHANTSTSAFPARGNILFPLALNGSPSEDHSPQTRRSLPFECDRNRRGFVAAFSPKRNHQPSTLIPKQLPPLGHRDKHLNVRYNAESHNQCTHIDSMRCSPLITLSSTSVSIDKLSCKVSLHPNQSFATTLIHNLTHGCSIGYNGPQFAHTSRNLPSAFQQPEILDTALAAECAAGRILGPYNNPPLPNLRCTGLGLIPKHDGGWRTIYHLSAPVNHSINDFINPDVYTLSYCSVDHAFAIVNQLGKGALLAKIDLKNAFRLMPVRQED